MFFLLYLSQLLFDSLKVLGTLRVKTKSAAWVHLGERHLLWRRAMKRLDGKPPHILENTPHVERTTRITAHTQTVRQQTRCIPHYLQNEMLFICCHIIHTSVCHRTQKHKVKLLCWFLCMAPWNIQALSTWSDACHISPKWQLHTSEQQINQQKETF